MDGSSLRVTGKSDKPLDQLLIIGNGFDLECGLASRYEDFFTSKASGMSREEAVKVITHMKTVDEVCDPTEESLSSYRQTVDDVGLTVWDLILLEDKRKYWYGIENAIERFVVPEVYEKRDDTPTYRLSYTARTIRDLRDKTNADPLARESLLLFPDSLRCAEYIVNTMASGKIPSSDDGSMRRYLFEQLERLEAAFAEYLRNAVLLDKDYDRRATCLFEDMLKEDVFDEDGVSVLSFNYMSPTTPTRQNKSGEELQIPIVNVHGCLRHDNIVFGIDNASCISHDASKRFTKTRRQELRNLPTLGGSIGREALRTAGSVVQCIKFYGHSLANADYSYFQWLFDAVDLYNGDTSLVFYYRPELDKDGNRGDLDKAREVWIERVSRLLEKYGMTLANAYRGANLEHILLNEGRLLIKLLPGY